MAELKPAQPPPGRRPAREETLAELEREQEPIHRAARSEPDRDPSARRHLGLLAVLVAPAGAAVGVIVPVAVGVPELAMALGPVLGVAAFLVVAAMEDGRVARRVRGSDRAGG